MQFRYPIELNVFAVYGLKRSNTSSGVYLRAVFMTVVALYPEAIIR